MKRTDSSGSCTTHHYHSIDLISIIIITLGFLSVAGDMKRVFAITLCGMCITFILHSIRSAHLHNKSSSKLYAVSSVNLDVERPNAEQVVASVNLDVEGPQTEQINIVYIKTHKCASETLSAMFRRFGYQRDLSFVIPVNRCINLGYPYYLEEQFYRPSKTGGFNILCDHSILTLPFMEDIMPSNTMFVTSIRSPFEQFKSAFNFFHLRDVIPRKCSDPISEYLRDLPKYDQIYKETPKTSFSIPLGRSITRNSMSQDLGLQQGFQKGTFDQTNNVTAIAEWLKLVDKRFEFVVIVEHMHVSLILLRHALRWNIKDIIYVRRNTKAYTNKERQLEESLLSNFKAWSKVDYLLFDHFNKTLWRKVAKQNSDFENEIRHFEDVMDKTQTFCNEPPPVERGPLYFPGQRWSQPFNVTPDDCVKFGKHFLSDIKGRYNHNPVVVTQRKFTKGPKEKC